MLAAAFPIVSPSKMPVLAMDYVHGLASHGAITQRQFKRHKTLPHPQRNRGKGLNYSPPNAMQDDLALDTSVPPVDSQSSSPRTLKHQNRRIGTGPELPPTPPSHSRTSSSTHSQAALPSSPTLAESPHSKPKDAVSRAPATPPDQRSPPTPDVTPPQPANRPKALRPTLGDRGPSRTITNDSRTESFITAREEPLSSDEDDGKSTARPSLHSGRTSQTTVRRASGSRSDQLPDPKALDMALSRLHGLQDKSYDTETPEKLRRINGKSSSRNPSQPPGNVDSSRKRHPPIVSSRSRFEGIGQRNMVVEDLQNTAKPTNATMAVRQLPLNSKPPLVGSSQRSGAAAAGTIKRSSSSPSTIAAPKGPPTSAITGPVVIASANKKIPLRQKTLRHVQKQRTLRDSMSTSTRSKAESASLASSAELWQLLPRPDAGRHESYSSSMTSNSIASTKARREIWKSGSIPVVVVPDRLSSTRSKSSRTPSLRSTSSRRSKRSQSLSSTPIDGMRSKEVGPVFERQARRSRAYSSSESSDVRTIDFPPTIPRRTTSLSAPTSRTVSRANSITADAVRPQDLTYDPVSPPVDLQESRLSTIVVSPLSSPSCAASPRLERKDVNDRHDSDHFEDALSARRFPARNTPFSVASAETGGTAAEVSEALAVQMYPHQNSSVLMVNHSARPSESSDIAHLHHGQSEQGVDSGTFLMTPPQLQFTFDEIDSPLRNPRSPPEPPTQPPEITFIPATPSGVTPGPEKAAQLGNYYESMAEQPPPPARRPSIVDRALGRGRRHSLTYPPNSSKAPKFLSRSWSLSRRRRRRSSSSDDRLRRNFDDEPPEEDKLHPFWRPQWPANFYDDGNDDYDDEDEDDRHFKYPLVDNRPSRPRRSLSDKMKRTFAIFPVRDNEVYPVDDEQGPERRTIRRTSSGNLRVIRRRSTSSSLEQEPSDSDRPYTAPEGEPRRSIWRGSSVHHRVRSSSRRRFSLSDQLEEIQDIPRRMSERRREKRSEALRQKISGPTEVRDGVEEVIRPNPNHSRYNNRL